PGIVLGDLGRQVADLALDLLLGEQHRLDVVLVHQRLAPVEFRSGGFREAHGRERQPPGGGGKPNGSVNPPARPPGPTAHPAPPPPRATGSWSRRRPRPGPPPGGRGQHRAWPPQPAWPPPAPPAAPAPPGARPALPRPGVAQPTPGTGARRCPHPLSRPRQHPRPWLPD